VKSVEGVELLRTQIVLEIEQVHSGDHTGSPMVDIELVRMQRSLNQRLQLVILESLVIRRDIPQMLLKAVLRLGYWWKMGK